MRILVIAIFVVATVAHFTKLIIDAGAFRKTNILVDANCKNIKSPLGPEDMQFDPNSKLLFISASPRSLEATTGGGIYVLKVDQQNAEPQLVTGHLQFPFLPHGISIFSHDNLTRLFVINHAKEGSVEILDWNGSELEPVKTIQNEVFKNIHNDIAAVDQDSFYLTVEQGSSAKWLRKLESYSRIGFGKVLFYNGKEFSVAASGLHYANGIVVNDQKVFVAEMLALKVSVFNRLADSSLTKVNEINLDFGPDNLNLGEDGSLWVAGHSNLFRLQKASEHPETKVPSKVVLIRNPTASTVQQEVLYRNDGSQIASVSVAAPIFKKFYLGSIFTAEMLQCEVK